MIKGRWARSQTLFGNVISNSLSIHATKRSLGASKSLPHTLLVGAEGLME